MLARNEYSNLDNFLETSSNHVVLEGQSGVGKTVYLTYRLVRRLIAGLPTVFAKQKDDRYVSLDSGVYWIPSHSFNLSGHPPFTDRVLVKNTLVLFDLNEMQSTPEQFQHWRVLASSSPQPGRCKEWAKHRLARSWTMKTWSSGEINFARYCSMEGSALRNAVVDDLERERLVPFCRNILVTEESNCF